MFNQLTFRRTPVHSVLQLKRFRKLAGWKVSTSLEQQISLESDKMKFSERSKEQSWEQKLNQMPLFQTTFQR